MARKVAFAIIGAGNGGLSMAGDLIFHGFEVSGRYHDLLAARAWPLQQGNSVRGQ